MKAALTVFRIPAGMDRSVESCAVCCSQENVQFRIKYKPGFVKTNRIPLVEAEVLQASYEEDELPGRVVMEPKVLSSHLASFHTHEITWAVTQNGIQFRNFSELVDDSGGLRSEVSVGRDELLELVPCGDAAELTFCLAELKTILTFAEHMSTPLKCSFSGTGQPVYFIVNNQVVSAHVVLSTLDVSCSQSSTAGSQPPRVPETPPPVVPEALPLSQHRSRLNSQQHRPSQPLQGSQELSEEPSQESLACLQRLNHVLRRKPFDISKLPGYHEILAPDSDDEN